MLSIGPGTLVLSRRGGRPHPDLGRRRRAGCSAHVDTSPGAFALSGAVAVAVNTTGTATDELPGRARTCASRSTAATLTVGTQAAHRRPHRRVDRHQHHRHPGPRRRSSWMPGGAGFRLVDGSGTLTFTGDEVVRHRSAAPSSRTCRASRSPAPSTSSVDTATSRLEVSGLGVVLTVRGQRLSGDLTVALAAATSRSPSPTPPSSSPVASSPITDAAATLTVTADGIAGTFSGDRRLRRRPASRSPGGRPPTSTPAPGTPHVRVTAAGAHLSVAGQEIVADLILERTAGDRRLGRHRHPHRR